MSYVDHGNPIPAAEMRLIRIGDYLWAKFKALRANSVDTHREKQALLSALETIWAAKRELRGEIAARSTTEFQIRKNLFTKGGT